MFDKKQLNEEELEKVTGGCYGLDDPKIPSFSGYLNMYSLEEGKEYYFVYLHYEQQHWCKGIVRKTGEVETGWFNATKRKHKIQLTQVTIYSELKIKKQVMTYYLLMKASKLFMNPFLDH